MKDLGIKDGYLFGGTASAWSYYVKKDLERERGLESLQKERFDYAYDMIFRANQDFDFVIDGTAEQAQKLESLLSDKFEYFMGSKSKSVWEVRLLRDSKGDKEALLDNKDFLNQHTDSMSTGLINLGDCEGIDCIKDLRDWDNPRNNFIQDTLDGKITYYYSKDHKLTNRFKEGKNPEIFSVVRYFTKAVQYELDMRDEDLVNLRKIIKEFDPNQSLGDSYASSWLEKNGKKLIKNAIDMEYAWNLIDDEGLRTKLIDIKGNQGTELSLIHISEPTRPY